MQKFGKITEISNCVVISINLLLNYTNNSNKKSDIIIRI